MVSIESGVQVQILLEGFVIFFSFIRLVGNPTSDCKRNEGAKDAYKSYPLGSQGITSSSGLKTQPTTWLSGVWALSL